MWNHIWALYIGFESWPSYKRSPGVWYAGCGSMCAPSIGWTLNQRTRPQALTGRWTSRSHSVCREGEVSYRRHPETIPHSCRNRRKVARGPGYLDTRLHWLLSQSVVALQTETLTPQKGVHLAIEMWQLNGHLPLRRETMINHSFSHSFCSSESNFQLHCWQWNKLAHKMEVSA